ncbi:MAG: hypothetical protein H7X86_09570 [Gorillibacterium sp.]|nr:hypothetical protein [Gorillibacterium sp.]
MATIVLHKPSGVHYVMVGTGYGAYKALRPSFLGGALFPHEESDEIPVAAVCDEHGNLQWYLTDDLQVVEIDGAPISRVFARIRQTQKREIEASVTLETCPACGSKVRSSQKECPSCGLTLILDEMTDGEETME